MEKNPYKTMFKGVSFKKNKFNRPEGAGNFDNMDDINIVQSINCNQGTIQHIPTNAKDIVNKEYADSVGGYWSLSGSNIYNNNAGNVGIGTDNPIVKLDLKGNFNIKDIGETGFFLNPNATFDTVVANYIGTFSSGDGHLPIILRVNGVNRMFIGTDGKIGIGTASPTNKLDITTGATTTSAVHIGEATDVGGYFTSTVDSQSIWSGGAEFVNGSWIARDTTASQISLTGGDAYIKCNTGLTAGNTFTPTTIFKVNEDGLNLTANKTFIRGSVWLTKVINFNDASPVTILDVSNGYIIEQVNVWVGTTWDGNGTVDIGDEDDADGFMTDAQLAKGVGGFKGLWGSEHGAYLYRQVGLYSDFTIKRYLLAKTIRATVVQGTSTKGVLVVYVKLGRII